MENIDIEDEYKDTRLRLSAWGLSHLIPTFIENKCTSLVMRYMKESHVAQLCPTIGDQVLFISNRDEWVKSLEECNQATTSFFNMDSQNICNLMDSNASAYSDSDAQFLSTPPLPIDDISFSDLVQQTVNTGFDPPSGSNNPNTLGNEVSSQLSPDPNVPRYESLHSQAAAPTSISIGPSFVRSVLRSTADGRRLTKRYTDNGCLDADDRKELVHVLIQAILGNEPWRSIHTREFVQLAIQIEQVFPREAQSVYYVQYLAGTSHQSKRNASGLLYQRYIGYRRYSRSKERIPVQRRKSSGSATPRTSRPASPLPLAESLISNNGTSELDSNLRWLQNYSSMSNDWDRVERLWQATRKHRLDSVMKGEGKYKSVNGYFNIFKVLKDPNLGFKLLKWDFNNYEKTANKEDCLLSSLMTTANDIFNLARKKVAASKDKDFKKTISTLLDQLNDDLNTGNSLALILLPYLLKNPVVIDVGHKKVKPSKDEISESFIAHVKNPADAETYRLKRIEDYAKVSRSIQPYVMYTGESFVNPTQVFAVVDDVMYHQSTICDAVQLLFEIFHVTYCSYPPEAYDIWLFIQRGFYKIHDKCHDRPNSNSKTLLTDLGFKDEANW